MTHHTSAGLQVGMSCRRAIVPTCIALVLGCAPHRIPQELRGYEVLVEGKDEQSRELARAMRGYGFRVREKVRGGSRPTAALIYFTFSDPGPGQRSWLHVRLADTRSGVIVGAAAVQLDSQVTTPRARANAAVLALVAP
jgi:hypothetical protein